MAGNQLSGAVPVEIGNLSNLRMLHLNQNLLEGDIPDTFTNLINIFAPGTYGKNGDSGLDLDYNKLNVPPGYPDPAVPLQVFLSQKDPNWQPYRPSTRSSIAMAAYSPPWMVALRCRARRHARGQTTFTYTPQLERISDTVSLSFAGSSFQLTAEDECGTITVFDPPLIVTLCYSDDDLGIPEERWRCIIGTQAAVPGWMWSPLVLVANICVTWKAIPCLCLYVI